jgi:hypothetical protein
MERDNASNTAASGLEIRAAEPATLKLSEIILDPEILLRPLDEETAQSYADAIRSKARLPPIYVMRYPDGTHVCVDGQTRIRAHAILKRDRIECTIVDGDRLAAVLASAKSNTEHGRPRDADTKKRAVLALRAQPEWADKSVRWIAEAACVSPTFASEAIKLSTGGQLPPSKGRDGKIRKAPKKPKRKPFDSARAVKTLARTIDQLAKKWPTDAPTEALVELLLSRAAELDKRKQATAAE